MLNVDKTQSLSETCLKLRNDCLRKINEGIDYKQTALRIKPNYTDAMFEMMFLFEFRSRLACGEKKSQENDHEQSLISRRRLEQRLPDTRRNK